MLMRVGEVRFDYLNKAFMFDGGDMQASAGEIVVVETEFGLDMGELATDIAEVDVDEKELPLKKILRTATDDDREKTAALAEKEKTARDVCREEIEKANLGMKLVTSRYTFDGSKLTFCYTADGRVDFRELVKTLASRLRTRIELRQVGVRDEARLCGGIGPCGRSLCCAAFLHEFQSVSIRMAKEQGLPLNPMKISGICGRLFCCLKHEYENYVEMRERLPRIGSEVNIDGVKGRVIGMSILKHSIQIDAESGRTWVELPEPVYDGWRGVCKCPERAAAIEETAESAAANEAVEPDAAAAEPAVAGPIIGVESK
ncbi:MAG: stage 0 sporulation family protein [bacterium]